MKSIYLIRHAKSSWDSPDLADIHRPLGQRGRRDAPQMAKLLKDKGLFPEKLISSPAQRAHDTAVMFAKELGIDHWDIQIIEGLYEAYPDELAEIVCSLDNKWQTIALFGHNPGFTLLANRFAEGFRFDNVPTCGIVHIKGDVDFWSDFVPGKVKIIEWFFPKEHLFS